MILNFQGFLRILRNEDSVLYIGRNVSLFPGKLLSVMINVTKSTVNIPNLIFIVTSSRCMSRNDYQSNLLSVIYSNYILSIFLSAVVGVILTTYKYLDDFILLEMITSKKGRSESELLTIEID